MYVGSASVLESFPRAHQNIQCVLLKEMFVQVYFETNLFYIELIGRYKVIKSNNYWNTKNICAVQM